MKAKLKDFILLLELYGGVCVACNYNYYFSHLGDFCKSFHAILKILDIIEGVIDVKEETSKD